jgi:DNA-binding beta-propeller fold protein YncE
VADDWDGTVSRIDATGVSAVIPVGPGARGIAVGAGAVWVADTLADRLVRIDPTTDTVTTPSRTLPLCRAIAEVYVDARVADAQDEN